MHEHLDRQNTPAHFESQETSAGLAMAPPQFKLAAGGDTPSAGAERQGPVQLQADPDAPIQRQVGRDYDNLAERIHTAIDGWGTDEEQVYLALNQVRGDAAAIEALKERYQQRYNVSLEDDIRGDFSGSELDHALALLNSGTNAAAPAGGGGAGAPDPHQVAADAIHNAVDGWGTDEEAIFAALEPFGRNLTAIHAVMDAYQQTYGENMRERLVDELSGTELQYAMHLIGDEAMVANVEIQDVTPAEAQELFNQLAALTFWTDENREAPIPFHYPPDGCYARAHLMAQHLTALGYASEKVFAVSTKAGGLNVPTDYAPDAAPGTTPSVTWWYHVAPIIRVRQPDGSIVQMVMDPSMASSPVPIATWTGMMRPDTFDQRTAEQMREQFTQHGMPVDENLVYTANRDSFGPTNPRDTDSPDPESAHNDMEGVRGRLTDYSHLARAHEIAAAVRTELRNSPPNADNLVAIFTAAPSADRQLFVSGDGVHSLGFPGLIESMRTALSTADFTRVQAAMNP